jgi:hypothetical protein
MPVNQNPNCGHYTEVENDEFHSLKERRKEYEGALDKSVKTTRATDTARE